MTRKLDNAKKTNWKALMAEQEDFSSHWYRRWSSKFWKRRWTATVAEVGAVRVVGAV
jgi:hypothetical protein